MGCDPGYNRSSAVTVRYCSFAAGRSLTLAVPDRTASVSERPGMAPNLAVEDLEALTVAKRNRGQAVKQMIGRFVVADPEICHGQPTFRGTRILVADVLEQVAAGVAWETIVEDWRGDVSADAIAEAVLTTSSITNLGHR